MAAGAAALAVSQRGADYAVSPFAVAAPFPVAVVCARHVEHFALARVYNGRHSLDVVCHAAGGVLFLAVEPRALHALHPPHLIPQAPPPVELLYTPCLLAAGSFGNALDDESTLGQHGVLHDDLLYLRLPAPEPPPPPPKKKK